MSDILVERWGLPEENMPDQDDPTQLQVHAISMSPAQLSFPQHRIEARGKWVKRSITAPTSFAFASFVRSFSVAPGDS
jgi:hypothetical protein